MVSIQSLSKEQRLNIAFQCLCWSLLFFMAVVFYKERVCIGDAAYILNELIAKKSAVIIHNRYTLLIAYCIPLTLIKAGASLKTIMIGYSINQYLATIFITGLTIFITKQWNAGWYFLVAQVLYVQELFYYLVLEPIVYMMAVMYFVVGVHYLKANKEKPFYLTSVVIMLLTAVSSPNNIILLATLLILLFLLNYEKAWTIGLRHVMVFFAILLLVKFMMPLNSYEGNKLAIFKSNLDQYKQLDKAAIAYYARGIFQTLGYKIIGFVILGIFVYKRMWRALVGSMILLTGVYYLICIYLFKWEASAYMELYYQVVGIPIACLFCYLILETSWKDFSFLIFILVFVFGFRHIIGKRNIYINGIKVREDIIEVMRQKNIDKGMINHEAKQVKGMVTEWAAAYEVLLLSTLKGSSRSFFIVYDQPVDNCNTCFISSITRFENQDDFINQEYFILPKQKYQWIFSEK